MYIYSRFPEYQEEFVGIFAHKVLATEVFHSGWVGFLMHKSSH